MRSGEETRSVFLLAALLLAACGGGVTEVRDGGAVVDGNPVDAIVYQRCSAVCVRPSDCAIAYPDLDICPPGFRCSRDFMCISDGGSSD